MSHILTFVAGALIVGIPAAIVMTRRMRRELERLVRYA